MRNIFIIAILLLSTVPAYARASLDKGAWNPEYTVRTLSAASRASSLSLPAAKSTEINADTMAASHAADTIAPAAASAPAVTAESADTTGSGKQQKKRTSYWHRLFKGNEDHTFDKKLDISFVLSPSYTREASFGIGGLASGLYRLDRTDSIMKPSDVTIMGNVSVSGLYVIAVGGNNYFKGNRSRLSYEVAFANQPLRFWGIDYASCAENPPIDYTRRRVMVDIQYLYRIVDRLLLGVRSEISYVNIKKIDDPAYLQGQAMSYTFTGIGLSLQYDSRDFIPNPQKGIYAMAEVTSYPRFLGTYDKTRMRTTLIFDTYHRLWESGILATDIYGRFNGKNTPWILREQLGGSTRMRGYYAGRYIDNNILSCQAELRQRIYKRIGCTVWGGCGTVFPSFGEFNWKNILPTYGVGLRWEFKHRVNIRIDYGFGKNSSGFIFNINEAF